MLFMLKKIYSDYIYSEVCIPGICVCLYINVYTVEPILGDHSHVRQHIMEEYLYLHQPVWM